MSIVTNSETQPLKQGQNNQFQPEYSQTVFSDEPAEEWLLSVGERTRLFCYSKGGLVVQIGVNTVMLILNLFLILYELFKLNPFSEHPQASPPWFIACDLFIVFVLFVEVLARFAVFEFSVSSYLRQWSNAADIIILILSIAACMVYIVEEDVTTRAQDNFSFLIIRISRDLIRLVRCFWFISTVYESVVEFDAADEVIIQTDKFQKSMRFSQFRGNPNSTDITPQAAYGTFLEVEDDGEGDDQSVII